MSNEKVKKFEAEIAMGPLSEEELRAVDEFKDDLSDEEIMSLLMVRRQSKNKEVQS